MTISSTNTRHHPTISKSRVRNIFSIALIKRIFYISFTMVNNTQSNEGQKPKAKTKEELEAEQQAAKEQLQAILDNTR